MARVDNSDYGKLVQTINAMQALVEDAGGRFMLYREQCREMVHEFMHMRDSILTTGEDGEYPIPILRELYRMVCEAKRVLECCNCKDQTSWLRAALLQNDEMVFEIIRNELKWGFRIFREVTSTAERPRAERARWSLFDKDQKVLKEEIRRLTDKNNVVPELDRWIATFLHARITKQEGNEYFVDHMGESYGKWGTKSTLAAFPNACSVFFSGKVAIAGIVSRFPIWESCRQSPCGNLHENKLGHGLSGTTEWFGIRLFRKTFFPEELKSCLKEAATMAELVKHPNVVKFISCSKSDVQKPAIIMEHMEMNLENFLDNRGNLNFEGPRWVDSPTNGRPAFSAADPDQLLIAVDIMYQISVGMAYLHLHNIAHLDLKPGNILVKLCEKGNFRGYVQVKIADLGVSVVGKENTLHAKILDPRRGTPLYQAPETSKRGEIECLTKADLYGFAIICWVILHGKEPWLPNANRTISRHREKVENGERLDIDSALCPIPLLKELIQDCWHQDPNKRPSFSACSLQLQSCKAMLLGSRNEVHYGHLIAPPNSAIGFNDNRIKRLWRIFTRRILRQQRIG